MKKYFNMLLILLVFPLLVNAKSVETSQFGYGGAYNETFNSVEKTNDGGYVVVGSTKSKKINEVSTGVGNGLVVKYDKNGYAVVELNHEVHVSANNTGKERRILIEAQHTSNSEYRASLLFIQPAKVVEE